MKGVCPERNVGDLFFYVTARTLWSVGNGKGGNRLTDAGSPSLLPSAGGWGQAFPWKSFWNPVQVKMLRPVEQRTAIELCVKLDKTVAETVTTIKTGVLSNRRVFRWHKVILEGQQEVNDEARAGPMCHRRAHGTKMWREWKNFWIGSTRCGSFRNETARRNVCVPTCENACTKTKHYCNS